MKNALWVSLFLCSACTSAQQSTAVKSAYQPTTAAKKSTHLPMLLKAEKNADQRGQRILQVGRKMALETKEIVRGSCWDYINTVYNRAGYPQAKRQYVLKGKKNTGPYAKASQIHPGDWLYYINHSYNRVEHSGIFVRWVDKPKKIAQILSYGGERRNKPGRYRNYDLSNVYTIIRAK